MKFIYSLRPISPRSTIFSNQSSILDPDFPVNLEILIIKIILFFSTTEVITCSKVMNTFEESCPYKHMRDTYVTLGWISTDAFLAPHVNARKF